MTLDPILQGKVDNLQRFMAEILAADPEILEHPDKLMANPELAAPFISLYQLDLPYDPPRVGIDEQTIPGPRGDFRIRIYQPAPAATTPRPALVWAHGGAFMGGSIDMNEADVVSREVCARAGAVVVSVDYHLANGVDVTYPQLHQECAAAWLWTRAHSPELGVDSSRIALGGASAGGALAIAATLDLRSRGEELPARLALAYPDARRKLVRGTPESEASMTVLPPPLWQPSYTQRNEIHEMMFRTYLGSQTDTPYVAFEDADLSGFPPLLIIVAEYDDLRPGAEAFAEQARRAGVPVELYVARGVFHGHLSYTPALPEMDATIQQIVRFVKD
jgi:acetyl esterase/lipase